MPDTLSTFIKKSCEPDPYNRFQNASQALAHLTPLIEQLALAHRKPLAEEKMTNLPLIYREKDQLVLHEMMAQSGQRINTLDTGIKNMKIGAIINAVDCALTENNREINRSLA